jgi:hypothetical protein
MEKGVISNSGARELRAFGNVAVILSLFVAAIEQQCLFSETSTRPFGLNPLTLSATSIDRFC